MSAADPTLRLLDQRIADLIRQAQRDESLRGFACDCADYALTRAAVGSEELRQAVETARTLDSLVGQQQVEQARATASGIAEALDNAAFDAQDAAEQGKGSQADYVQAFHRARAASSVVATLQPLTQQAAAEACYEAYHATENWEALLNFAQKRLA